jgi:hypothetical protein
MTSDVCSSRAKSEEPSARRESRNSWKRRSRWPRAAHASRAETRSWKRVRGERERRGEGRGGGYSLFVD